VNSNIGTDISSDTIRRHDTIAAAVLGVLVGLAALGAGLAALLDATGHPLLTATGLAVLAAGVAVARWVVRRVRERREDAADAMAGAAWRAQHLPHLAAQLDRDRAGQA
jgi:hypothetical protein